MCAMAKAIESALAEHGFIEDRHPFLDTAIGREDCRTAGVSFDQQIIEVRGRLAREFAQCEVIDVSRSGLMKPRKSRSNELSARERARVFSRRSSALMKIDRGVLARSVHLRLS